MGKKRTRKNDEEKRAARKVANKKFREKTRKRETCNTCSSNVNTMVLQAESNKKLCSLLASHSSSTSFEWPDKITHFGISDTVTAALFNGVPPLPIIADDDIFQKTISPPIRLRILTIPHKELQTPKLMEAIKGGKIEKDFPFEAKTVLSNPGDGTVGLVILQSKSGRNPDFVFMCTSNFTNEVIVRSGEEEDTSIKEIEIGSR